jgi:hypothetical protein
VVLFPVDTPDKTPYALSEDFYQEKRPLKQLFGSAQQILRLYACRVVRHHKHVFKGRGLYGVPPADIGAWGFIWWR